MANLSLPGNHRYQPKDLRSIFGHDNLFRAVAEVEIATLKTLADIGIIPAADIASLTASISVTWSAARSRGIFRRSLSTWSISSTPCCVRRTGHHSSRVFQSMKRRSREISKPRVM